MDQWWRLDPQFSFSQWSEIGVFFHIKWEQSLISKLYFINYVFPKFITPLNFLEKGNIQNKIKPLVSPQA